MVRIFFLGSMMKTERMVKAIPFSSTLSASWWSILQTSSQFLCLVCFEDMRCFAPPGNLHVVCQGDLPVLVANDGEFQLGLGNLVDVLDPAAV